MLSKKNVLTLLVLVVALALVSACGAATPETIIQTVEVEKEVKVIETVEVEKEVIKEVVETVEVEKIVEVPKEETVELRIAWWGSQNRHDRTIAAIELYEEENPNIDIVYEFNGWEDHWTKLATQAAGGKLPDISNNIGHHNLSRGYPGAIG